jgi:hypothetical protein
LIEQQSVMFNDLLVSCGGGIPSAGAPEGGNALSVQGIFNEMACGGFPGGQVIQGGEGTFPWFIHDFVETTNGGRKHR